MYDNFRSWGCPFLWSFGKLEKLTYWLCKFTAFYGIDLFWMWIDKFLNYGCVFLSHFLGPKAALYVPSRFPWDLPIRWKAKRCSDCTGHFSHWIWSSGKSLLNWKCFCRIKGGGDSNFNLYLLMFTYSSIKRMHTSLIKVVSSGQDRVDETNGNEIF